LMPLQRRHRSEFISCCCGYFKCLSAAESAGGKHPQSKRSKITPS